MEIDKLLFDSVKVGADQLKKDYNARDFNTTGKLESSIKPFENKIIAKRYIFKLIYGAAPGKKIDYKEGSNLFKWTGIKINPPRNKIKSVSYLTSKRLFEDGDQIYRGDREPLDVDMTISLTAFTFIKKVRDAYNLKIKHHNERKQ